MNAFGPLAGSSALAAAKQHGPSTFTQVVWPAGFRKEPSEAAKLVRKSATPAFNAEERSSVVASADTLSSILEEVKPSTSYSVLCEGV